MSSSKAEPSSTDQTSLQLPEEPLQLLDLPREILLEIFRHLLLPFDSTRIGQHLPLNPAGVPYYAQDYETKLREANPELKSITKVRNRIHVANDCLKLQTQVLLVCRTFGHLGNVVLAENEMAELVLPWPVSIEEAAKWNLSLWEIPNNNVNPSVRPIIRMSLAGSVKRGSKRACYLFEWRDMRFIVSYLLGLCRYYKRYYFPFVNIKIFRTEVPGLIDVGRAADHLFLSPIYPFLNGLLGKVTHPKIVNRSQSRRHRYYRYVRENVDLRGPLTFDTLLPAQQPLKDPLLCAISEAIEGSAGEAPKLPYHWHSQTAEQLWSDRMSRLTNLAYHGCWDSSPSPIFKSHPNWENLALARFDEVDDQRINLVPIQ